jgi:hypothetical protein
VLQGQDPLALLLAARERQFSTAMAAAGGDHERAVGRLKAAMAATATDGKLQVIVVSCQFAPLVAFCTAFLCLTCGI